MLTLVEQILFALLAAASAYITYQGVQNLVAAIRRGQPGYYPRWNYPAARIRKALWRTLNQSTVFRARPLVSFLHSFVFYGFIFYGLVNIFDGLQGYIPPAWLASLHFGMLGNLYRLAADAFSVLVLVGVAFFLLRRFVTGDRRLRFNANTLLHEKVQQQGIKRDSLIVGVFIMLHVGFRLLGESFLLATYGHIDPWQPAASSIAAALGYNSNWMWGWHVGWWGALGLILLFLPYFPRSKHIHLFMAPVNFALEPRHEDGRKVALGTLEPIDFEDESLEQFGASKLEHLRSVQILDAYACIQCNRCSDVCPAQTTGKALSPAAIEINKRYELNTILPQFAAGEESPRVLSEFVLDDAALWACTTCGACIEVCPVGCEQMIDIIDIRRDKVMMQGEFPAELNAAFRGMERTGNPWGIAQDKREEWLEGTKVQTVSQNPDFEVLFWVGCAGSYDPAAQRTTKAMAEILDHAGVNYAVLGKGEKCTGDPARRAGNEYLYYQLASENVMVLNEALINESLNPRKRKRVVTTCPHCFNALFNDYPQLGGHYDVLHHSQLIDELIEAGSLPPMYSLESVTFHDPCYLGRHNDIYQAPRNVLRHTGRNIQEMPRHANNSFCCGAGGAQFWKEEEAGHMRVSENRFQEAMATGAKTVAAACPFCKVMLSSSESAEKAGAPEVRDIAEIVADNLRSIAAKLASNEAAD